MVTSETLLQRKARTRELGKAPLPPEIREFVDAEFAIAREWIPPRSKPLSAKAKSDAEAFFRRAVSALSG
jgi:hypothetical protein